MNLHNSRQGQLRLCLFLSFGNHRCAESSALEDKYGVLETLFPK